MTAQAERTWEAEGAPQVFGSFIDETIRIVAERGPDTISFAVGSPALDALQLVGAADLARAVIEREPGAALGYGITEGDPELREIVVAAAHADGIPAADDGVLISAGALQAIDLACRVHLRPGDTVVVESPGFANVLSGLRNHGARLLEVPVDDDGMDVSEAARLIARSGVAPRVFVVVPNFQNPTGATLSLERRHALLALAAEHRAVVIEDDPYRLLRYRGADLPPLAALAEGVRVIYCGSFSKTFLPGIRVGWAIADPETIRRMSAAKQTMDSSTSSLGQRLVVEFYRRGRVADHLAALRLLYAEKQTRAFAALARELAADGFRWNDPEGGFYVWVRAPRMSTRVLLGHALDEGVAFVPGDAFQVDADHSAAFRFSYSSPSPDRIDEGVRRLRRAYHRMRAARA